jgi:hypothetical protein
MRVHIHMTWTTTEQIYSHFFELYKCLGMNRRNQLLGILPRTVIAVADVFRVRLKTRILSTAQILGTARCGLTKLARSSASCLNARCLRIICHAGFVTTYSLVTTVCRNFYLFDTADAA